MKALDQACQQQLWGHAFALAQRLGPAPLNRVMERFLARAVHPSDPLLTLYQLTAGEIPRSVDQLAYSAGERTPSSSRIGGDVTTPLCFFFTWLHPKCVFLSICA